MMGETRRAVDYSEIHRGDSPANRVLRAAIWPAGDDLGQHSFVTPAFLDRLVARLGIDASTQVLDLGSGTGGPATYIADQTGCRMTGIEVNEVGVEVAEILVDRARMSERIDFVLGDALCMPFPGGAFDVVVALNVMNVFTDKVAVLREVRRVLRPGGTVAILSGTFEWREGDDELRERISEGYTVPQYTDTHDDYMRMLADAGFVVDEVTADADFPRQLARWLDGWRRHRDLLADEQGPEKTDEQIAYFAAYQEMVDAGRASNHLIFATRPPD